MISLYLAAAAQAVAPGGLRVGPGVPASAGSIRQVFVAQADGPEIAQTTVRAQVAIPRFSVDAELPMVHARGQAWSDTGVGNLRMGVRHWFGTLRLPVSIGVEVATVVAPEAARVRVWGSLARETVPRIEMSAVGTVSFSPEHPTTVRWLLGWISSPVVTTNRIRPPGELAVVHLEPLGRHLGIGFEVELVTDPSPLNARAFTRVELGLVNVDLGLQAPIEAYASQGARSLGVMGQVRHWWR